MKKQTKLGLVLAAAAVISVSVASLVSARGWVQQGADWYYVNNDGEYVTDTIQSSGNSKFYLGEDGAMQRDYFLEDYNENAYYFGQNGAMVTNTWVAIDSTRVSNTDDYIPDNFWYYFQASGKAMKGTSEKAKKATIDGKKYMFNEYGQMAVGWFDETGKTIAEDEENPFASAVYYAGGDNDGVLRTGWLTYYDGYGSTPEIENAEDYTNLYFYFNPSNCRKYGYDSSDNTFGYTTKKINGRTYAFNPDGVMISGWDVFEYKNEWDDTFANKVPYFSGEDDGHQVKKGWVYAVPSGSIDQKKHDDDEEVYMYFLGSGDSVRDQFKKINGKWYCFDHKGMMKTGLVIWSPSESNREATLPSGESITTKYISKLDLDYAEGADIAKWGLLQTDSDEFIRVNEFGEYATSRTDGDFRLDVGTEIKLHYLADDGSRKTGSTNTIEFNDNSFVFASNTSGNYATGVKQKKYYSLGILLKADPDIRYGIYNTASSGDTNYAGMFTFQSPDSGAGDAGKNLSAYKKNLENNIYQVLTTGGALQKGNNGAKKDADGNFWLIDKTQENSLKGIWDREVNLSRSFSRFQTRTVKYDGVNPAVIYEGDKYNICDATMSQFGLGLEGSEAVELGTNWVAKFVKNSSSVVIGLYFEYTGTKACPGYKTDYGDKNKYVPMGLVDNAGNTVTMNFDAAETNGWAKQAEKYLVKPSNEHFVNCLWYSGAVKYTY